MIYYSNRIMICLLRLWLVLSLLYEFRRIRVIKWNRRVDMVEACAQRRKRKFIRYAHVDR